MIKKVFLMMLIMIAMTISVKAQQSIEKEAFIQDFCSLPEESIRQVEQMFAEQGFQVKVSAYYSEEYDALCFHYEYTSMELYKATDLANVKETGMLAYLSSVIREDPTGESLEWLIYKEKQFNIGLCWKVTCQDKTKHVIATPGEIEEFYYKNEDLIYSILEEQ